MTAAHLILHPRPRRPPSNLCIKLHKVYLHLNSTNRRSHFGAIVCLDAASARAPDLFRGSSRTTWNRGTPARVKSFRALRDASEQPDGDQVDPPFLSCNAVEPCCARISSASATVHVAKYGRNVWGVFSNRRSFFAAIQHSHFDILQGIDVAVEDAAARWTAGLAFQLDGDRLRRSLGAVFECDRRLRSVIKAAC